MHLDPADFILADDLVREMLEALAEGHARLVEASQSPLGRLAVKSAQLTVHFDFSVVGKETQAGTKLRVRPGALFGFAAGLEQEQRQAESSVVNRATLVLDIVNVVPPAAEASASAEDDVRQALEVVAAHVRKTWPKQWPAAEKALRDIAKRLDAGDEDGAKALVAAFVADLRAVHEATRVQIPARVAAALALLDVWAGKAARAALTKAAKARLQRLPAQVDAAGVDAQVARAFAESIAAAKATGRASAARLLLYGAVADAAPHLSGKVLPTALLDDLEALDVLDALETSAGRWREGFEASLKPLAVHIERMALPASVTKAFTAALARAQASRSAVEAGSRLVAALGILHQATEQLDLPASVRAALDHLATPPPARKS